MISRHVSGKGLLEELGGEVEAAQLEREGEEPSAELGEVIAIGAAGFLDEAYLFTGQPTAGKHGFVAAKRPVARRASREARAE